MLSKRNLKRHNKAHACLMNWGNISSLCVLLLISKMQDFFFLFSSHCLPLFIFLLYKVFICSEGLGGSSVLSQGAFVSMICSSHHGARVLAGCWNEGRWAGAPRSQEALASPSSPWHRPNPCLLPWMLLHPPRAARIRVSTSQWSTHCDHTSP